jgi:hypothetical protein
MKALALILILIASPVSAAPFIPDSFSLTLTRQYFETSGTDTLCVRCDDADATNDTELALDFHGGTSSFLPWPSTLGSLDIGAFTMFGDVLPDGFYARFVLEMDLLLVKDAETPIESLMSGFIIGEIFTDQFMCCVGTINTMDLGPTDHWYDPLWIVNGVTLQTFRPYNAILAPPISAQARTAQVAAVPEPLSLFLIGAGGVLGVVRRVTLQTPAD